uniref:Uncharacterized protein n=1 Tax=Nelumbo nucifera TaxID=4432 RepID=A0A822XJK8_NELNU|nr:TPA_asm: hypothetical protein HUJ06_021356 [Nelumbo nucifera]
MSCLNLGKKLSPAGKAWKGFTFTLQRKLHKLKRSKAFKITTKRLNTTLTAVLGRSPPPFTARPQHKTTKGFTQTPTVLRVRNHHKRRRIRQRFAPVYVDELFVEPFSVQVKCLGSPPTPTPTPTGTTKVIDKCATSAARNHDPAESSSSRAVLTMQIKRFDMLASPETIITEKVPVSHIATESSSEPAVPQLKGVDERAEEFIAKFRAEMMLQRQRSFSEYQEMLKRGC